MHRSRTPFLPLLALVLALAACAPRPDVVPPELPPPADYHLLMGELALLRGFDRIATEHYAHAMLRTDDAAVARRATLLAVNSGDRIAARAAADRWEALAPDDLEAAQFQAVLHARAGEIGAARDYLLRVADGESGQAVGANLQMITALLAGESNIWRSADLMAWLAAARPDHAEGWYGAALLALEADRPAEAVRFADRALERDPNLLDAMFLRARAAIADDPANADPALAPLAGFRNAADAGMRYRYAALLVLAGREAEADAVFEDILVSDPDQHDARLARALLALDHGRLDMAETELRTLLARHGRVQDALYYLGELAERRGALNEAADRYARVAPDTPRWLDAQAALGRILLTLDGEAAARRYFDELRARHPERAQALVLREAALYLGAGRPILALQILDAAPAAGFDAARAWHAGLAAAEAGRIARAEAEFAALLAFDPGNPLYANALGYLLTDRTDRLAEAEALLLPAHAAAPANPEILDSLGWLRFRQGQPAAARPLLERSWELDPSSTTGEHLLATLRALGDNAAAEALERELEARRWRTQPEDSE